MPNPDKIDNKIYEFIKIHYKDKGYPPTVREICANVGLSSPSTVHQRLKKLEALGLIEKENFKNRSIKIADKKEQMDFENIPIYGKITAGVPITAIEDIQGTFPIPSSFANGKELFLLKVSGDSMINAAILDSDMIIVNKQSYADNGDIVAALINKEEATCKTFYKENGRIRLQPQNDSMEPIFADDVQILGKVVGVIRLNNSLHIHKNY